MAHSERTCIGCRSAGTKQDFVRLIVGPDGLVIDYREKLPGRAAYVCPRRSCIERAMTKAALSRAFRANVDAPGEAAFIAQLAAVITNRIKSLVSIARKAGKIAAGFSAVRDALEKKRVSLLLFAEDLSDGTREKLAAERGDAVPGETLFTREDYGALFGRELVGVAGILDQGLAHAIMHEVRRLKNLINSGD